MPANTATGYPYPLGTDRLMDGDDAIHNLAAAIPQVQAGAASVTITAVDTNTSLAVTYPKAFVGANPTVVIGFNGGPPGANYGQAAWATSGSLTGFNLNAKRATANPVNCAWVAVGLGAP